MESNMCDTRYCHGEAEIRTPTGAWYCEKCHDRYLAEREQAWIEANPGFAVINGTIRRVGQ